MKKKRVLLVDDHPLMRAGLTKLINSLPDFEVCGEVAEARMTLDAVHECKPDLVLLDISMQGESGLEVLKEIKAQHPKVHVLILSMHDETVFAPRALRAGAAGYVSKNDASDQIVTALRRVAQGGVYLSEVMSGTLLRNVVAGRSMTLKSPVEALSDRELEVFTLLGKGLSTREIAAKMGLSVKTVESHRANIKEKLNIHSAPELMKQAVMWVTDEGMSGPKKP